MRTRAAKILTEVFAPPILVLTLLLVWAFTAHRVSAGGLLLGAVATLFAAGLPYAIMLVGIRRDRLSDRHLSPRTEPPVMMIIGPASGSVDLLVMVGWTHRASCSPSSPSWSPASGSHWRSHPSGRSPSTQPALPAPSPSS
jgi:hypothetical protein